MLLSNALTTVEEVIGAVGISGDTSDKDEFCAITAIKKVGFKCDPPLPSETWQQSSLGGK